MRDRYPGYDVLAKRHTLSWNTQTRAVIERRLALDPDAHRFFTQSEWSTLQAICARIIPQQTGSRDPVPIAAMIDKKLVECQHDGYRDARLGRQDQAWQRGLAAIVQEALSRYSKHFHELDAADQDALLRAMQNGELKHAAWGAMPADVFFRQRLLDDVVRAYYAHPTAWSEIGWGGPASPRGYVRMDFDRHDPWEAAEAKAGREDDALRKNSACGPRDASRSAVITRQSPTDVAGHERTSARCVSSRCLDADAPAR